MNILARTVLTLGIATGMVAAPPLFGMTRAEAVSISPSAQPRDSAQAPLGVADDAELRSLVERELAAQGLENFRGGDPVVIVVGGTTLLVILLVVLIIILLR